jgi:SM-20-related protein
VFLQHYSRSFSVAEFGGMGGVMSGFDKLLCDQVLEQLGQEGWFVGAMPQMLVEPLAESARQWPQAQWRAAGVGRQKGAQQAPGIRRDKIAWLSPSDSPAVAAYWQWMMQLQAAVNERFFVGLFDYECHFAQYQPGDFYKMHVDAFASDPQASGNRKLSSILYLNENWRPEDGGELALYCPKTQRLLQQVSPRLGILVLFWSEEFPHEVLPAQRSRHSLTGWFRTRGALPV